MNKKYVSYVCVLATVAGIGFYLGNTNRDKNVANNSIVTKLNPSEKSKALSSEENFREISSIAPNKIESKPVIIANPFYKKNKYLNDLMKDQSAVYILNKSSNMFKDKPMGEDIAIWLTMATTFDSSDEYGELLMHALNEMNQDSKLTYKSVSEVVKTLTPNDDFIRGQILNLVNVLNLKTDEKIEFFSNEASRKVILDTQGHFSPDSLNITTSMALLSHSNPGEDKTRDFIKSVFEKNKTPEIRKKLALRLTSYFPEFSDDIKQY